ncbi:hypothetical protein G647_08867 [Cladophialophora carrionii CBS 160.54]|uniref:Uncharacterized protein n=1 Tax=Cladophialophora carrionii CBS 160.54 TaxID=1279043 RepID=V9D0P8_9EURO|nr:uncharacterized protein G647_08867 [Cladophialophora carrionii CBS 160.54]ETI19853.1 hypothetical protein G647_08867 [Cladophialophora carrionii CBS 160.54]
MLIKSNGKALRRPVLSPDGKSLAVIAPDDRIHLINLSEAAQGRKFINGVRIIKSVRPFIRMCTVLRWSPEVMFTTGADDLDVLSSTTSECELGNSWLLLSDTRRVIAMSTDLRNPRMMPTEDKEGIKSKILADYDLGSQNGKVGLLEFVFDHRHALVIFELGSSAAILSLSRPQRDEIPHVKFPDARSLARAPDSRYFALLRRDKAQDKVTVFHLDDNSLLSYKSFDCNTSDAQSVTWCPTGQPLLAICDSPAYGVKVSFVTAQGHALNQFDIGQSAFQWDHSFISSRQSEGVGLTYWSWRRASQSDDHLSLQVLANGEKQVLVRSQPINSRGARPRAQIVHPDSIDGSKTLVWLESTRATADKLTEFTRQIDAFEVAQTSPATADSRSQPRSDAQAPAQDPNQIDIIEPNCTQTIVATRLRSSPRMLFLWRSHDTTHPHAVIVFRHGIRQIHFHPYLPHVLTILTSSKYPRIYAWCQPILPPIMGLIPIDTTSSTNFCGAWLPGCVSRTDSSRPNSTTAGDCQRCPFLFTSDTAFEAGYLSSDQGQVVFESILHRPSQQDGDLTLDMKADESTTEIIDTPSRPSKNQPGESESEVFKKARFNMYENYEKNMPGGSLHQQAGYGHAW